MSILLALLFSAWMLTAVYNNVVSNNTWQLALKLNRRWTLYYHDKDGKNSCEIIDEFYSPWLPSNWFGFKAYWRVFHIPAETACDRICEEYDPI